jgi:hypothetical protein
MRMVRQLRQERTLIGAAESTKPQRIGWLQVLANALRALNPAT